MTEVAQDLPDTDALALPEETPDNTEGSNDDDYSGSSANESNFEEESSSESGDEPEAKEPSELEIPEAHEEQEGSKLPKWALKRIEKKEREIAQKAAEAEMWRNEAEKRAADPVHQNFTQQVDHNAPRREDFEDEDSYIDARFDYRERKKSQEFQSEQARIRMVEAEAAFNKNMAETIDKGSERYNDFEEKVAPLFRKEFPPNRAMAEAIVASEFKSDLLYFLGTYPQEAIKIAKLNAVEAIKEITKLEVRMSEKKKTRLTKAPPPVIPLKGGSAGVVQGDPNKMDQGDFEKWYNSKVRKK